MAKNGSMRRGTLTGLGVLAALCVAAVGGCGGCGGAPHRRQPPARVPAPKARPPVARSSAHRPNIVFVLTDDLAWNLVRYMPQVQRLRSRGVTFSQYFVTDSLCCPSRASIFTGRLPHDTGIFSNTPPDGGFVRFHTRGEEGATFATALQQAGYRTAMMGKYLNGYRPAALQGYVPPGWSAWSVGGDAYAEFGYALNEDHRVAYYDHRPRDYLTDVLARKGVDFVRSSAHARQPFMLELATFAPHAPYTPAPRDAHRFPRLNAPRTRAFDTQNTRPPRWLGRRRPLTPRDIVRIDYAFRQRVRAVQAVDRMLAQLEAALRKAHVARNTYIVFSSDNGLHMGEHRLLPGKLTAFDSDIRVPLVVVGPRIPHGRTVRKLSENIDLAPTFTQLAHTRMADRADGRSLVPLLLGRRVRRWRQAVLVEHRRPVRGPIDPDLPQEAAGNPSSYEAIRTARALYVQYLDGEVEYYDLTRDPQEVDNTASLLGPLRRLRLLATLARLERCHGASACWRAGLRGPGSPPG